MKAFRIASSLGSKKERSLFARATTAARATLGMRRITLTPRLGQTNAVNVSVWNVPEPSLSCLEIAFNASPPTVALLFGPLVLFAITDTQPGLTRAALLAAKRTGQQTWEVQTVSGRIKMLPFTAIAEEPYSTYFSVA